MIRVSINGNLSVDRFRIGPLDLTRAWTEVDPNNPEVRETLIAYVGTHIQIHPEDISKLDEYGLKFEDNKLVDTRASQPQEPPPPPPSEEPQPLPPPPPAPPDE